MIRCPYCRYGMQLKGAKPGKYSPRCPQCREKFELTVPDDPNRPTVAAPLKDLSSETLSPAVAAALGIEEELPQPLPQRTAVQQPAAGQTLIPTVIDRGPRETIPARAPAAAQTFVEPAGPQPDQPAAPTRSAAASQMQTALPQSAAPSGSNGGATIAKSQFRADATSVGATRVPTRIGDDRSHESSVGLAAGPSDVPATAPPPPMHSDLTLGETIGGYELMNKLGQGGMGAVYLARQVSLDRNVALKVLTPELAQDPQFIARFTREALAAAQLTHHNVVQIHDFGQQNEVSYFSMEFVQGATLSKMVREHGKLDVEQAVTYVLQAARGLEFAHKNGLIHRDVKPDNLLLNEQGIVKVADLGLVKQVGRKEMIQPTQVGTGSGGAPDTTQASISMGTPAYMPPEQAQDAANVDQRADIYSLGCTLYDLLTGRPPFTGKTAMEVITKHQRENLVPPDAVVTGVPRTLSVILMKMMAKRPNDRYQTMGEVIKALEDFLGVSTSGPFQPKEEHVKVLEGAAEWYNTTNWAKWRPMIIYSFYALCALGAIIAALVVDDPRHKLQSSGAFVGLGVLTTLSYLVTAGLFAKTYLFKKLRQLVFGASIGDWLLWGTALIVVCMSLYAFDQHWGWIGTAVLSVMLACAFHFGVDGMLAKNRAVPVLQVEQMLKTMRLRGLDENHIHEFVCKYGGDNWEEFYEELFGYEAKLLARTKWGQSVRGRERKKFAAWRDPVIRWIDQKQQVRDEVKQRKLLAKLEAKALAAKGIGEKIAKKQAERNAEKVVAKAQKIRSSAMKRLAETALPTAAEEKLRVGRGKAREKEPEKKTEARPEAKEETKLVKAGIMEQAQEEGEEEVHRQHENWFSRRYGSPLDLAMSQQARFVLAALVLFGFAVWWKQTRGQAYAQEGQAVLNSSRVIGEDETKQVSDRIVRTGQVAADGVKRAEGASEGNEYVLPGPFPDALKRGVGSYNGVLAGFLLLTSVFYVGNLMGFGVMVGALVALVGHKLGLPVIGDKAWLAGSLGVFLWMVSIVLFREQDGY